MKCNILLIVGSACLFYFILYITLVDITNVFTWFWFLAGAGCIGIRWYIGYLSKRNIQVPVSVLWVTGVAAGMIILLFGIILAAIVHAGFETPEAGADYVLVLGCQVKGERPTYALEKRLDAAYEYLLENPNTKVILSGGQGPGEDVTEAYAMKVYLEHKGIAPECMLLEDESRNTDENIAFSRKLIGDETKRIVLVTNYFHVLRGVGVAKKQGLVNVEGQGAPSKIYTVPNLYMREIFAVIKYKLKGRM